MCLSRRLLTLLIVAFFCIYFYPQATAYAQTVSPTNTNPLPSANVASPTPQASATPCKADSTLVKVSTSELVFSGFPTWIIAVLIGVAAIVFLIWYFLLRSKKRSDKSNKWSWIWSWASPLAVGICITLLLALTLSVGILLGRRSAREELRDFIAARGGTIEFPTNQASPQLSPTPTSPSNAQLTSQASPQQTPEPSPSPQPSLQQSQPQPSAWPISTIVVGTFGFLFLIGAEILLYIWLRWGYRGREINRLRDEVDYLRNR
jgi:hypothetical protein